MCIKRGTQQRGMTLIELIVFIVVVSVGLAGVLTVFSVTVRNSADPLVVKQALAVADSLLEEILLKDFCDPDSTLEVSATTAAGSPSVTGIAPALDFPATNYVSWRVSGQGIAAGTTVQGVASNSALSLSANAGTTTSNLNLRLSRCVADSAGETRATYDDVRDYHNATWQDASGITGAAVFNPSSLYKTQVEVSTPTLAGVAAGDALRVVVRVEAPDGQVYAVTGYRFFND